MSSSMNSRIQVLFPFELIVGRISLFTKHLISNVKYDLKKYIELREILKNSDIFKSNNEYYNIDAS